LGTYKIVIPNVTWNYHFFKPKKNVINKLKYIYIYIMIIFSLRKTMVTNVKEKT
jgi:hypothetical protein